MYERKRVVILMSTINGSSQTRKLMNLSESYELVHEQSMNEKWLFMNHFVRSLTAICCLWIIHENIHKLMSE